MTLPTVPDLFPSYPTLSSLLVDIFSVVTWLWAFPTLRFLVYLTVGTVITLGVAGFVMRVINPSIDIGGESFTLHDIQAIVKTARAGRRIIRGDDE